MARCGCSQPGGVCTCAIVAGDNVTVSGTGNPATPYVISTSDPAAERGYVEVDDTLSLDMSISGAGSLGDPYQVSGDVNVDPDDGNLLQVTAEGLLVPCASVVACVGAESPGELPDLTTHFADCGFGGAGTELDPITLTPSAGFQESQITDAGPRAFPGGSTSTHTLNVVNPSDSCSMLAIGFARVVGSAVIADNHFFELSIEYGWDGDTTTGNFWSGKGSTSTETQMFNTVGRPQFRVLGPSGDHDFTVRVFASGGNAADHFQGTRLQIDVLKLLNPMP